MDQLIANIDSLMLNFVAGSFGGLTDTVQTLWRLMFIVFIAIYGYKIFIHGRFSAPDLVTHCIKIIIVLILATQWSTFYEFIYRLATDMPADLAGRIMQAAASSLGAQTAANSPASANTLLSVFYDRAMAVSSKLLQGAGWSALGLYFYAGIVWLAAGAFTGYAAMLIILSKLAVAVLLAVGPFFILLLIFHDTRKLFEGWLRALLNYAMVPIFVYTLLALLLAVTFPTLNYLETHSGIYSQLITAIGPFAITTYIATILLRQVMNIVANITGGVSLSLMNAFGSTMRAWRYGGEASFLTGSAVAKTAVRAAAPAINTGRNALRQALDRIKGGS